MTVKEFLARLHDAEKTLRDDELPSLADAVDAARKIVKMSVRHDIRLFIDLLDQPPRRKR